jgi:signal transduction histidine kinase
MQNSEQILELPYERRSEPRKKALIHAFVSDREDIVDLKCVIRNISKGGCCIASSYIQDLPRIIEIVPEGFDRPMTGKIIWRTSKVAGVQFLNAAELSEFEGEKPKLERREPKAGFFAKLQSLAGLRRRSGQATRDDYRPHTGIPNFGARVLHGVRNPLTAIKSLLQLLMGDAIRPIPRRAKTIIRVAHENAEKAESLVEEALQADRLGSGDLRFNVMPLEIVALVSNSALVNTGFAAKHDVRFEVKDDVGEAMVNADPARIEEVLSNLLSSAAKFSPIGEMVTVSITRNEGSSNSEAAGQTNTSIRISVSDRGMGSNVWHGDADGKHGGTDDDVNSDLGMKICQTIIERHKSTLQIDARPGSGTTVWFELPEIT